MTCNCVLCEQAEREKEHDRFLDQQHRLTSTTPTVRDRACHQGVGVFCGCVEINLQSTVQHSGPDNSGLGHVRTGSGTQRAGSGRGFAATGGVQEEEFVRFYPLTRRDGAQVVSGEMQASAAWDVCGNN